nr:E3 SUMO-protein ligase SIZ1-like isoform X1 [Ipomoea batatas]
MSSSGDEQASSGGVDLRLLAAFRRWSDISSGGESLAAAVREQGAISLLARSPELQSIKDKLAYFRLKELKDVLTQLGVSKQGRNNCCNQDVDPCEDLTDEDIRTVIQNATQRSCLITTFHPYRRTL